MDKVREIYGMKPKGKKLYYIDSSEFTTFFDIVNQFEQRWNAFLLDQKQQIQYLSSNKLNEIDKFNQSFYNNYTMADSQLAKLIVDIRRGDKNESTLKQLYKDWEFMTKLRLENITLYKDLYNYFNFLKLFPDLIPNMVLLKKNIHFDDYLMSNDKDNLIMAYSFNDKTTFYQDCFKKHRSMFFQIINNTERIGNNLTFVAFNYQIYDRLAKHLVNRTEKCVICLFSKSRLIAYDLKQFYENKDKIEVKVNQIRNRIGEFGLINVS